MKTSQSSLSLPVRVFLALLVAAGVWLAPVFFNSAVLPSAAQARVPGCHRECTQWEPDFNCHNDNSCKDHCVQFEDVCNTGGGGGGGGIFASTITGSLTCAQPGDNDWCAGGLTLNLVAVDPLRLLTGISGDIDGTAFACPVGRASCTVPISVPGAGVASYIAESYSGLSGSGSTAYKLDATPPQIVQSISGTSGANGWHTASATLNASASDPVSGLAFFEILDNGAPGASPMWFDDGVHSLEMTIEIVTFILICALALILSLYHHRQAASLRAIENVAQDYYAMQFRSIRRGYAGALDTLNPFEWIAIHVSAGMDKPIAITDVIRAIPDVQAVDLRTSDNRRVVISTRSWRELYYFDRKARRVKKDDRLASFAARPLLNNSRFGWGVVTVSGMTSNTDEFFDLEADAVGKKLGVVWNQPTRLFFYVVE